MHEVKRWNNLEILITLSELSSAKLITKMLIACKNRALQQYLELPLISMTVVSFSIVLHIQASLQSQTIFMICTC